MNQRKTLPILKPPRFLGMPLPVALPVLYLILGALWIFFSDRIASHIAVSEEQLCFFSNIKGWLFIAGTALLLYILLLWNARKTIAFQQQMAESEQHLKLAQSTARIGSWVQDGKTDELTWSDMAYELFGVAPTITPSVNLFLERIHPDDKERVSQTFNASLPPGAPPYETTHRIIRADTGETRTVHERSSHLRDTDGKVVKSIGTVQDITELKTAERALEQSRKLMADVVDGIPEMVWLKDPDGIYLLCNRQFEETVAPSKDHIIGLTDYDLFPKEKADSYRMHDRKSIENRAPTTNEETTDQPDGHSILIEIIKTPVYDSESELIGVLGIGRDITHRKEAEKELAASEERFRTICENAPVLINGFDENGSCIIWNEQCRKTFGWTLEEIKAHDAPLELFYPDSMECDKVRRTVTTDPDGHFRDWHPQTKKGRRLITSWANFRLPNNQVFNIGHDITERKNAEEELKQHHEQLEERVSERTEELRQIVNLMAGRENRMAELKLVISSLRTQLEDAGMIPVATDSLMQENHENTASPDDIDGEILIGST